MLIYDDVSNKWINTQGSSEVSVTLTINGAKEDTISIYDDNDTLIDTCIFSSGQTSGTCTITIPSEGGEYKFVSLLAKGITNATISNNYEKTITLTNDTEQTVNVYPDNAIYWYGNEILSFRGDTKGAATLNIKEATKMTNKLYYRAINTGDSWCGAGFIVDEIFDTSDYTKLKIQFSDCSITTGRPSNHNKPINISFGTDDYGSTYSGTSIAYFTSNASTSTIYEYDVSSYSSMDLFSIGGSCWYSISSSATVGISRIWFE